MIRILLAAFILISGVRVKAGSYTESYSPVKIITITVNEAGQVFMGRDTLSLDHLAAELQNRLWKNYMGTGKMYDSIHLQFTGEVVMEIRGSAMDAIREAQKKTLISICLEKHKKLFEDITGRQQDKIRKQFPVLFQQKY